MVVLVACGNPKINEYYSVKIIGEGIEPHKANDKQELFEQLETRNIDVLIIDIETELFDDSIQTIKEIKIQYNQTIIIILTYKTGMEFAKKMQEMGVHGFISKTEEFKNQIEKSLLLLEDLKNKRKEQRKYMRIKPEKTANNTFILSIPGISKEYVGKVKDISLGGVAATMNENILDSLLYKGSKIEMTIYLNKMQTSSEGLVVARRGRDIAISLRNMSSLTRKKLSEYILSRID
ncbi:MAG: response regulator [bacterium]